MALQTNKCRNPFPLSSPRAMFLTVELVLQLLLPTIWALPTTNTTLNSIKVLSDVKCTRAKMDQVPMSAQIACDHLMHKFDQDYEDFGDLQWGTWAPESRQFPFMVANSECYLSITAEKPKAADMFSVHDLWEPFFDIYVECLLQRRRAGEGRSFIAGNVEFTGLGGWTLTLGTGFRIPISGQLALGSSVTNVTVF